jgi:hypothetical protein
MIENRTASPATGVLNSPLVQLTPAARKLRKRRQVINNSNGVYIYDE